MVESLENTKKLENRIIQMYMSKMNITQKELEEQLRRDVVWDAQTCLEKGLVDEVI